ncbi:MAG: hypothetical protein UY48_C0006G0035 [Candidatus Gottesmanbacteria bacterium GW2011_GWB1_49_7]|uniref:Uncharacterized protein n=1 Tax=Candidatus Gottesmanbacteria bacterium GW2011_GWB1_49_7 TaxID=1618448 RepID=A0A0G1YDC5_9BACT|nr:MAG: hypothetical protein UY48_C0006G0035 [Candidatus Gottesmanbacteria bacterium GW2011_GWB1_49_7]
MPSITFSITVDAPIAATALEMAVVLNQALTTGLETTDTNVVIVDNKGFFIPAPRVGAETVRAISEESMNHFRASAVPESVPAVFAHNLVAALKQACVAWALNDDVTKADLYLARMNLILDEVKIGLTKSRL